LHGLSTHPPRDPFPYPWEEIGPGYCYGPAFGHWDLIHQVLDVVLWEPEHARHQILNNLAAQQPDGLVPGSIWLKDKEPRWGLDGGHPAVWPIAVDAHVNATGEASLMADCFDSLVKQIGWFEANRATDDGGFFYIDLTQQKWESGIDQGIRFDEPMEAPSALVDATSHVYQMYAIAARWAEALDRPAPGLGERCEDLKALIGELYDAEQGFFFDRRWVGQPDRQHAAFDGIWPVVVGAATEEQAGRVIDEWMLNEKRFYAHHPISTVGVTDSKFELRMWRGPTWNSMTMWASRGCLRYGRKDAAAALLGRALDASSEWFEKTGTIWEFYHPHGEDPRTVNRKPETAYNAPCSDYLGHNPLLVMAKLWEEAEGTAISDQ
jgi:glycogen debranching enzyme